MHKSYQSVLPCQNKLLKKRWDQTYYDEHRKKVREALPMVNTKAPQTYMHLHVKLKKMQIEEERLATVERDNRILLEKMSYIMRTKGRVDNLNDYEYKSMNREKRQRELLRVTRENQAILKRIMMRSAEYSQEKWQREWGENQQFLDNISHYPSCWWLTKEDEKKLKKKQGDSARSRTKKDERKSQKHEDTIEEEDTQVKAQEESEPKEQTPEKKSSKKCPKDKKNVKASKGGDSETHHNKEEHKEEKKDEKKEVKGSNDLKDTKDKDTAEKDVKETKDQEQKDVKSEEKIEEKSEEKDEVIEEEI